jgi:hypothetical protein
LFVLPNLVAILYVNANLPETRNRETDQIVEALRRRTGFLRRNVKGLTNPGFKKDKDGIFVVEMPFSDKQDL